MPDKWKIRAAEFMDALSLRGIATAAELAERASVAKGTAERVMRGHPVNRATVIAVCGALSTAELSWKASDLFEAAQ